MADFVTAWIRRFETLAGLECDAAEVERLLADLAADVRRDAGETQRGSEEVVLRLEALAQEAELEARNALEARDQYERLRYASVLRRGAGLLRGGETDR